VLRNCRDVIDRQLTHVTRLVDDLLDVGRLTTGKIKLRKELVRLSDIVARSVETVRPLIGTRRHTLDVQQPREAVYVNGDSTRLSQVLQNLLVNAAKYTPDGGHITLQVRADDSFAYVTVQDNGRGIAAEDLQRIFQLFAQAETAHSAATESGLGIGLTLARTLVELHGGTLTYDGVDQDGTRFRLAVPLVADAPPPQEEGSNGSRPPEARSGRATS